MAEVTLPGEVPGGPDGKAKFVHFRRQRELARLQAGLIDMQRRHHPPGVLGPAVASAITLLASHQRAFHFFSEERRDAAVASLDARSEHLEPPPHAAHGEAGSHAEGRGRRRR